MPSVEYKILINLLKLLFSLTLVTLGCSITIAQSNLVKNPSFESITKDSVIWNSDSSIIVNVLEGDTILYLSGDIEVQYWNYNGQNAPYSNALFWRDKAHSGNMYSTVSVLFNNQLNLFSYYNLVGDLEVGLEKGDSIIISFWSYLEDTKDEFPFDLRYGVTADSVYWWKNYPNGTGERTMDMLASTDFRRVNSTSSGKWMYHETRTTCSSNARFIYFQLAPKKPIRIKRKKAKGISGSPYISLRSYRIDDVSVKKIGDRAYQY